MTSRTPVDRPASADTRLWPGATRGVARPAPGLVPPRNRLARPVTPPSGCGSLVVTHLGSRSVVSRALAASPLRLLMPGNHGHGAWVYTSTFGGGLVDADAIDLTIEVGTGATALLSTQASTKIYRSPRGTASRLRARVGPRASLLVVPDPLVAFAGSRYRQTQEFDLTADASLVVVDWITSGRQAFGERWACAEYASRLVVRREDELLVHDALSLRADDGDVRERMGRFDVLAVVVLIGPVAAEAACRLPSMARGEPIARRADRLMSATPIGGNGCLVRLAGTSTEQVGAAIRAALDFVPAHLGDDPWARRN